MLNRHLNNFLQVNSQFINKKVSWQASMNARPFLFPFLLYHEQSSEAERNLFSVVLLKCNTIQTPQKYFVVSGWCLVVEPILLLFLFPVKSTSEHIGLYFLLPQLDVALKTAL